MKVSQKKIKVTQESEIDKIYNVKTQKLIDIQQFSLFIKLI